MIRPSPGISIVRASLEDVLDSVEGRLIHLHEKGDVVREGNDLFPEGGNVTFLLSDDMNLLEEEADIVAGMSEMTLSLGEKVLHTHMAIVVIHYLMDTAGR